MKGSESSINWVYKSPPSPPPSKFWCLYILRKMLKDVFQGSIPGIYRYVLKSSARLSLQTCVNVSMLVYETHIYYQLSSLRMYQVTSKSRLNGLGPRCAGSNSVSVSQQYLLAWALHQAIAAVPVIKSRVCLHSTVQPAPITALSSPKNELRH